MLRSRHTRTGTSRLPWTAVLLLTGILVYLFIIVRGIHTTRNSPINDVTSDALAETPSILSELGGTTATTETTNIVDFERQDGVVLAVKIHGITKKNQLIMLKQSLCLLKAAYNHRVNYDHIIFSTIPIPPEDGEELRKIVAPAKLTLLLDTNPSLQEVLLSLTKEQQEELIRKCDVTSIHELEWLTKCHEPNHGTNSFAYTWQAEFRSKHIWNHPYLDSYKYMLWFDADAMCTKVWDKDPIAFMIRNDLNILFDHFPQGTFEGKIVHERIRRSFDGTDLCGLRIDNEKGHMVPELRKEGELPCDKKRIGVVHGFFHITNLDFYRSGPVRKWAEILIGNERFSRQFDDQVMVTVPAAILTPEKARDMRASGFNMQVMHNGQFDGYIKENFYPKEHGYKGKDTWYVPWFEIYGKEKFPEAYETCRALVKNNG